MTADPRPEPVICGARETRTTGTWECVNPGRLRREALLRAARAEGVRMNHNDPPEPRCAGRSWLFLSTDRRDHEVARAECLGTDGDGPCPAIEQCRKQLRDMQQSQWVSGLHGTWAGKLYGRYVRESV